MSTQNICFSGKKNNISKLVEKLTVRYPPNEMLIKEDQQKIMKGVLI